MKLTINSGNHRPCPPIISRPIFNFNQQKTFQFTDSCWWWFYDPDKDGDWSKIIGFINGFNIHGESYRFGFRPHKENGFYEITPYIYQCGIRLDELIIIKKELKNPINLSIKLIKDEVYFDVDQINVYKIKIVKKSYLGFTTGIYIGGGTKSGKDWSAPHKIILYTK
jgi:hypothetical protein